MTPKRLEQLRDVADWNKPHRFDEQLNAIEELADEVERLRQALEKIAAAKHIPEAQRPYEWAVVEAKEALGQGEKLKSRKKKELP